MAGPRRRSVLISRLAGKPLGSSQGVILDELRACILDGEVPPGSPIPVDGVAAAFGVSRIPVREALMTLIGEGLVDHRPHLGYQVARMTAQEFGEIYLVREAWRPPRCGYVARAALARDGADVVVLGCAGMADLAAEVSRRVGVPVVDGVAAATLLVQSLVTLGLGTSKHGEFAPPIPKPYTGVLAPFGPA
ncbi:GntR family transcriptional regulator [Dactylosporangium sp. NPDC050688]|uniref:GntR family transcriptional regulator n=1 Tax=Dactylosporangium sp. NPDC050688 TaxID=3157217 RepID=UPI0033E481C8